jgi:hypothetical protein
MVSRVLKVSSGYGRRSTGRMPITLINGKRKRSRRTSLPLMDRGAEVVGLHQVEDEEHRMIMDGGGDGVLAYLLVDLRCTRPPRNRQSQHQCCQVRKKVLQCIHLGKPPRNERSKRWWFLSKGRKLYSELTIECALYIDLLLRRVLAIHHPYDFAAYKPRKGKLVFSKCARSTSLPK